MWRLWTHCVSLQKPGLIRNDYGLTEASSEDEARGFAARLAMERYPEMTVMGVSTMDVTEIVRKWVAAHPIDHSSDAP